MNGELGGGRRIKYACAEEAWTVYIVFIVLIGLGFGAGFEHGR